MEGKNGSVTRVRPTLTGKRARSGFIRRREGKDKIMKEEKRMILCEAFHPSSFG